MIRTSTVAVGAIGAKRRAVRVLSVCLLMLLCGCTWQPPHPFRIGTNVWPGYEALYLARELGEYDDTTIRLVELPNASEVIQALRNEVLEAAALTLDEALGVIGAGHDLKIVLVIDFSRGGDVLAAHPDIDRLEALRGRRIGVESTAVGAVMLEAALQRAGLSSADIVFLPMTADRHLEAYRDGKVDALVTFEPARSALLAEGARILFDSNAIPDSIVDVLVVRSAAAIENEAMLRRLLAGYFNALRFQRSDPQRAIDLMLPRLELSREATLEAFRGLYQPHLRENLALLSGDSERDLQATVQRLTQTMLDQGLLQHAPPTGALLDGRWLPEP